MGRGKAFIFVVLKSLTLEAKIEKGRQCKETVARAARPGPGMYTSNVPNTTADHFICSQVVGNNLHTTQQHNVQYRQCSDYTVTEAGHTYFLQNCSFCWFRRCLPRQCLHQDPILLSFVTE